MRKAVLAVLIAAVALGIFWWRFGAVIFQGNQNQLVELTIWGLAEDEIGWRGVLEPYQKSHPRIKISFSKQTPINYQSRLSAQLRAGKGPDIFPLTHSWIPPLREELAPAPSSVIGLTELSNLYYPLVKQSLVVNDQILGLPTSVDGLVLLVNSEILRAANVAPPKTLSELIEGAKKVTVRNTEGRVVTAGVGLGTTINVDYWPEIVSLLFYQQPSANLADPASSQGAEVLKFYTNFMIDPTAKTWDTTLSPSTQVFLEGKLGFYFTTISKAGEIRLNNPNLAFQVLAVPQLPGKVVGVGQLSLLGVSKHSLHQKEAWELVRYLTSGKVMQQINLNRAQANLPPRVYPLKEMAVLQSPDSNLGPFISSIPSLKGWYLNSSFQSSLDLQMVGFYKQAIDAVLQGQDPQSALSAISGSLKQALEKQGVNNR